MIAAGSDGLFHRFSAALELPDLTANRRFGTVAGRVAHRVEPHSGEHTAEILAELDGRRA